MWWVEAKDTAKRPAVYRTAPTTENYLTQIASSAKAALESVSYLTCIRDDHRRFKPVLQLRFKTVHF